MSIPLEEQLAKLEECGIVLDPGITIDDVLYSFSRSQYEERPFDLLLFVLGIEVEREPRNRTFCSRVWNFDSECICEAGDYIRIVNRLCLVAGNPELITDIDDFVDLEKGEAWLTYTIDGIVRRWKVAVDNDWADVLTLAYVMGDIERDGRRFYAKGNGQMLILFHLDRETADKINFFISSSSGKLLQPIVPKLKKGGWEWD